METERVLAMQALRRHTSFGREGRLGASLATDPNDDRNGIQRKASHKNGASVNVISETKVAQEDKEQEVRPMTEETRTTDNSNNSNSSKKRSAPDSDDKESSSSQGPPSLTSTHKRLRQVDDSELQKILLDYVQERGQRQASLQKSKEALNVQLLLLPSGNSNVPALNTLEQDAKKHDQDMQELEDRILLVVMEMKERRKQQQQEGKAKRTTTTATQKENSEGKPADVPKDTNSNSTSTSTATTTSNNNSDDQSNNNSKGRSSPMDLPGTNSNHGRSSIDTSPSRSHQRNSMDLSNHSQGSDRSVEAKQPLLAPVPAPAIGAAQLASKLQQQQQQQPSSLPIISTTANANGLLPSALTCPLLSSSSALQRAQTLSALSTIRRSSLLAASAGLLSSPPPILRHQHQRHTSTGSWISNAPGPASSSSSPHRSSTAAFLSTTNGGNTSSSLLVEAQRRASMGGGYSSINTAALMDRFRLLQQQQQQQVIGNTANVLRNTAAALSDRPRSRRNSVASNAGSPVTMEVSGGANESEVNNSASSNSNNNNGSNGSSAATLAAKSKEFTKTTREYYIDDGYSTTTLLCIVLGLDFCGSDFREEPYKSVSGKRHFKPRKKDLETEIRRRFIALKLRNQGVLRPSPSAWGTKQCFQWLLKYPLKDEAEIQFFTNETRRLIQVIQSGFAIPSHLPPNTEEIGGTNRPPAQQEQQQQQQQEQKPVEAATASKATNDDNASLQSIASTRGEHVRAVLSETAVAASSS